MTSLWETATTSEHDQRAALQIKTEVKEKKYLKFLMTELHKLNPKIRWWLVTVCTLLCSNVKTDTLHTIVLYVVQTQIVFVCRIPNISVGLINNGSQTSVRIFLNVLLYSDLWMKNILFDCHGSENLLVF